MMVPLFRVLLMFHLWMDGCTKLGDDPFTFPIGNGNVYGPLTISAPASQSDMSCQFMKDQMQRAFGPISDPGLFNVSNCEVLESWTRDRNNNLDVTVSWNAASGCGSSPYITNVSEVTLARFDMWKDGLAMVGLVLEQPQTDL